jgi:putative hydrolase of the HAD superfamily
MILWDFDGTLAERPGMWRGCLVETLDEHDPAHTVDAAALRPFLRDGFPWHRAEVAHPELCDQEAWWDSVGAVLTRAYEGVGYEPERAAQLARLARARYIDPSIGWRVFDDTIPTLTTLREAGWRHAVLSNHVPELEQILVGLGLDRYMDAVLCSAVTGYEKPHPDAFAAALRLRRDGEPVWMVGDNPEADVEGARRAGLPAILVRRNGAGLGRAAEEILSS